MGVALRVPTVALPSSRVSAGTTWSGRLRARHAVAAYAVFALLGLLAALAPAIPSAY